MKRFLVFPLLLLLAGCSVEKPADASNPAASAKWIAHCLKMADQSDLPTERIHWFREAYDHTLETGQPIPSELATVPNLAYRQALEIKDPKMFNWALANGAKPGTNYNELQAVSELGSECRRLAATAQPNALPFLMSEAIDNHDRTFFNEFAEAFKATGFKVSSPLDSSEFNIRYRRFVGERLDEALKDKDDERIRFLVAQMPKVSSPEHLDKRTAATMRAVGDHVFNTLKDETLATQLVELRFALNPVDLKKTPFGKDFLNTFREDPAYAIRTQQLDEWKGRMPEADAAFLLTLPDTSWDLIKASHLDEAIEINIARGDSEGALRLIASKASRKPLLQADYNELMNWALKYGDGPVFDHVIKQSGDIDIYNISFAALAMNRELFQRYAPQIMKRVYYTMETEPRTDGTTAGRIKQVFACGNEDAGLYLVHNYDLASSWVKATEGRTLLMDVCEAGNLKAARYLVEKREEDINAETGYSEIQVTLMGRTRPTEGKLSSIFFAAKSGNSELIRYLHSKGANVNAQSNYRTTPLMHAVSAGHVDAVKTLIALRANVNARMNPQVDAANLGELGAYEEISTPYRRAQTIGNEEILDILKKAGARP